MPPTVKPLRPKILRRKLSPSVHAYDAYVVHREKRTLVLRGCSTRKDALAAAKEFVVTGVRPPPKDRTSKLRQAYVRMPGLSSPSYVVIGRAGIGRTAAHGIYVGSFPSAALAARAAKLFEETGMALKGVYDHSSLESVACAEARSKARAARKVGYRAKRKAALTAEPAPKPAPKPALKPKHAPNPVPLYYDNPTVVRVAEAPKEPLARNPWAERFRSSVY